MMQRFQRFMTGRYGGDQLNIALLVTSMVFGLFASWIWQGLIVIAVLALAIAVFRMFSKNIPKRRAEGIAFSKLLRPFRRVAGEFRQRKYYRFFSCPKCKQRVRVPRGKGRVMITCPKCREKFTKTV